jgi:hypothetical protein
MGDELVAGVAQLVGVAIAGKLERPPDGGAIDRGDGHGRAAAVRLLRGMRIELLDDGKEISEELSLRYDCLRLSRYLWPSW